MDSESLDFKSAVRATAEGRPLESFFVERISQIPEVESLYKYEDGVCTILFTILSTMKYQQDVDTKVYEVEYMILENFPDANVAFRCVPRLGMADEDFLPAGAVRIYSRGEKL
jgi:hypothetical protein